MLFVHGDDFLLHPRPRHFYGPTYSQKLLHRDAPDLPAELRPVEDAFKEAARGAGRDDGVAHALDVKFRTREAGERAFDAETDGCGTHEIIISGFKKTCTSSGKCIDQLKVHNSWGQSWQNQYTNSGWINADNLVNSFLAEPVTGQALVWLQNPN